MTVRKRGKYFHCEFEMDGQRYCRSTKETTLGKARQFEAMLITKIREHGGEFTKKAAILADIAKKFLAEIDRQTEARNLDPDTKRMYHNGWRLLNDTDIAGMRINRITSSIAAGLEFPAGPWNARQAQATLSRILNWAAEAGYITAAPRIKRTRAQGREIRITDKIEAQLLPHMERDVRDVFVIMLDCGMRPEEVMRMRWENVNWDTSQYLNPFGKSVEARRFVPISDRMRNLLRNRQGEDSDWVFPGKTKAGHRITVAKQFEAAREAAGLDSKIVLYCARHEFATTYLEHGGDLATLKKLMGHSSIAVTEKYLHPGIAGAGEIINKRNRRGMHVVRSA